MYSPLTIANTIIARRPGLNPLALNKLVMITHGWSLHLEYPMCSELPAVWRYGPVYASLYDCLREFGNSPVHAIQPMPKGYSCPSIPETDTMATAILNEVVAKYAHFESHQLSALCHAAGTPWQRVAASYHYRVPVGTVIPEREMLNYYRGIANGKSLAMAA